MNAAPLQIPPAWSALKVEEFSALLMVVGAPDSGKTTFAGYLFERLQALGRRVAFLDGDPGQSALGPPTTLTLTFEPQRLRDWPGDDRRSLQEAARAWRYFVGATSPQGHMLPLLVGAARLAGAAFQAGAEAVIYDTCGLVDPSRGGLALKNAKLELLRPSAVFAIQGESELEPFLIPLRRSRRAQVVELAPSPRVQPRPAEARRQHRRGQFAAYFAHARPLELEWGRLAVWPYPAFRLHRLAALEDAQGFTLGLGIVLAIERALRSVRLLSPLPSLAGVDAVRLGDVLVDPQTFEDERMTR